MSRNVKIAHDSDRGLPAAERLAWQRVFASDPLPEGDRYTVWRDADVANLSTRFDTTPDGPFATSMDWLDLQILGIGHAAFSAQHWHRLHDTIARDGSDDLVVNIRHSGGARGDMAGRDVVATTGTIVLADLAQTQRHHSDASISTGFVLPRTLAERMLPSVRSLHGHVIAPGHAALLASHVATIRNTAHHLPVSSGPALAQTILDLLAMAVAASMGDVPPDRDQHDRGLRHQLCDTIERQLGSPSLNTARLSRALGVSRSTLYRLLQDEGGVQAYIRTRRLARVAENLARDGDPQTIATLAERWGFCDAAYLGRAFREVYGVTPGDYRAVHGNSG